MTRWRASIVAVLLFTILAVCLSGVGSSIAEEVKLGTPAPELAGGPWINGGALSMVGLRGRVTLVEFWTYG
jgi:hypothetical protein